jgi:elongation factor P
MIDTNDLRPGVCFEHDSEYWQVTEFQHVKPGKGPAFVRVKIRNLRKGSIVERTFRTSEKVEQLRVENRGAQFMYNTGDTYVFMDNESYDQIEIPAERLNDISGYMKENMNVTLVTCKGEVLTIDLPIFIESYIVKTDPGVRGDTAQGGSKPATIEGGAIIQVPLFINEGDKIKVDTREGRYIERVKDTGK